MTMREKLIAFLRELERVVPPPTNCHHALMYAQYGSDEAGWTDKLALQINHTGRFLCLFIDEGDFDRTPEELVAQVVKELQRGFDEGFEWQVGVGPGRFI